MLIKIKIKIKIKNSFYKNILIKKNFIICKKNINANALKEFVHKI